MARYVFSERNYPSLKQYKASKRGVVHELLPLPEEQFILYVSPNDTDDIMALREDDVASEKLVLRHQMLINKTMQEKRIECYGDQMMGLANRMIHGGNIVDKLTSIIKPFSSVVFLANEGNTAVIHWDGEWIHFCMFLEDMLFFHTITDARNITPFAVQSKDEETMNILTRNTVMFTFDYMYDFLLEKIVHDKDDLNRRLATSAYNVFILCALKQLIPTDKLVMRHKDSKKLYHTRYQNKTRLYINIIDSDHFKEVISVKGDAFKVSGHWRLQPYGPKADPSYKLIWINDYEKTGYRRRLTKRGIIK